MVMLEWPMSLLVFARSPDPLLKSVPKVCRAEYSTTSSGKQVGFQARSVVGGVFLKALADRELAAKWRSKDTMTK